MTSQGTLNYLVFLLLILVVLAEHEQINYYGLGNILMLPHVKNYQDLILETNLCHLVIRSAASQFLLHSYSNCNYYLDVHSLLSNKHLLCNA